MTEQNIRRVAMWSGPRNISTAMMRSWENRPDTQVVDEPFYACYLKRTGIVHPMQDEVLASQSSSWQQVISDVLQSPLGDDVSIQYQKHMTQHMVTEIDPVWFRSLSHAFLIRHPAEVVASYGVKRKSVTADDVGFKLQNEIFQMAVDAGFESIPVIDSKDVLANPQEMLSKLCTALGLSFDKEMLAWPAGQRDSDGVWASHWYQNVEKSTGFGPYKEKHIELNVGQQKVVNECMPFYEYMYEQRLRLEG
jgi:hypothetical protein